jgi:hypothetical protein
MRVEIVGDAHNSTLRKLEALPEYRNSGDAIELWNSSGSERDRAGMQVTNAGRPAPYMLCGALIPRMSSIEFD